MYILISSTQKKILLSPKSPGIQRQFIKSCLFYPYLIGYIAVKNVMEFFFILLITVIIYRMALITYCSNQ